MKKLLRYVLAVTLSSLFLFAQSAVAQEGSKSKISGRVLDSLSRSPVEYASLTLYKDKNPRPVNGASAGSKGLFMMDGLAPGTYTVKVDFIGYEIRSLGPFLLDGRSPVLSLGDILLQKKAAELQSVTVVAPQSLVENKIDKMVYNVEKDISSQGGVATDVLKKVPMVSVDVDGNVELQGNANVLFLINGKPSSIFGSNLTDALQSIPASQIRSIEVITSPGAKYDAEGTGGIINIVLKDNKLKGVNGNISLAAGSRLENGSLNLNARQGNFGMNAFFSGNAQLTSTTLNQSDRVAYDSASNTNEALTQDGSSRFDRNGYEAGLGFDWSIDKKNALSGTLGYDHFGNKSSGYVNEDQAQYALPSGSVLSDQPSLVNSGSQFDAHSVDWSLNYKKTFARDERELDIHYESSSGYNNSAYYQEQSLPDGDSVFAGSRSNNSGRDNQYNLHVDYVQPLSDNVRLETGVRWTERPISSLSIVNSLDPTTGNYSYDSSQSNSLVYERHVYAGYASLLFPAGKFLDVQAGLRYERTETEAGFSKTNGPLIPGYNTFAPSVILSHDLGNGQSLKLSYNKRLQRPDYRSLNPFVNASDPKNLTQGNPYLQPEIANRIDLTYSKSFEKGSVLNVVLFYHRSDQDIQPFIVYYPSYPLGDSIYTGVSVSTPMNVGSENNYGMNVFGAVPLGPKWNVRGNLFVFDRYITAGTLGAPPVNSFNYRVNLNADYQVSKTLVLEFFGNFNSARNEIQGRYPSFTSYNFAFRKQVWNKKGSFAFTTTNPFGNYVNQATAVAGQDFTLNSLRRIPYRSFGLNFTYKFGKLEFKKEKEPDTEKDIPTPDQN